jgi:hypothetical protein
VNRFALALALLLAAPPAHGKKPKKRPGPYGPSSRVERPAEARGQASLRVRSIDFGKRVVVVEVGGFPKAPAGNLFTFIDDRGRKFVAVNASCEPPFPSGIRVCDLLTPEGYERHPWVGLELHLHGLTSNTIAAPREEVERAYEAARALAGEAEAAEEPKEEEKNGKEGETPAATPAPSQAAPAPKEEPRPKANDDKTPSSEE